MKLRGLCYRGVGKVYPYPVGLLVRSRSFLIRDPGRDSSKVVFFFFRLRFHTDEVLHVRRHFDLSNIGLWAII